MNEHGRALLIVAGVVVMVAGLSGRLMPHQWFGISTAELIGYGILLVPLSALLALGIVIWNRQHQLLRRIQRLEQRGRRPVRGTVVRGPWKRSG